MNCAFALIVPCVTAVGTGCCQNAGRLDFKSVPAVNAGTQRENTPCRVSNVHTSENQRQFCSLSV